MSFESLFRKFLDDPYHDVMRAEIQKSLSEEFVPLKWNEWYLSVYPFTNERPYKYFSNESSKGYLEFLRSNREAALDCMTRLGRSLSHACFSAFSLRRWNEGNLPSNPQKFQFFDEYWNPEYQRYAEHVYGQIIELPLLVFSKTIKRKKGQPPKLSKMNLVQKSSTLKENGYDYLIHGFNSCVRNGIAHGLVDYQNDSIVFFDSKDRISLMYTEAELLLDSLVDNCHGMIFALLLFTAENKNWFRKRKNDIPLGIKFLLLKATLPDLGFSLQTMITSSRGSASDLNIYCSSNTVDSGQNEYFALLLAWKFMNFDGGHHKRIIISFTTTRSIPTTIFINNKALQLAYQGSGDPDNFKSIIEGRLHLFEENQLLKKLKNLLFFINRNLKYQKVMFLKTLNEQEYPFFWKRFVSFRAINNRSVGHTIRLESLIVVDFDSLPSNHEMWLIKKIVSHLRRNRLTPQDLSKKQLVLVPKRPVYVWAKVFSTDHRIRTLEYPNRIMNDLVMEIEWASPNRREKPIYVKNPDFLIEGIRVSVNKKG